MSTAPRVGCPRRQTRGVDNGKLGLSQSQRGRKGRIAKGLDGDLVLLDGDPAKDPTAFARVRDTIRGGRVIWGKDR